MEDIRQIVAANIAALRKNAGYTQLALAQKLQYSDKAVSKWESGASMPDAGVLLAIASLFGVTVDYLLQAEHGTQQLPISPTAGRRRQHLIIALLSVVWAVPASLIVALVFNSIWGKQRRNYLYISLLMWTFLGSVYLTCLSRNLWLLFVIGVPGQVIVLLWAGMQKRPGKT